MLKVLKPEGTSSSIDFGYIGETRCTDIYLAVFQSRGVILKAIVSSASGAASASAGSLASAASASGAVPADPFDEGVTAVTEAASAEGAASSSEAAQTLGLNGICGDTALDKAALPEVPEAKRLAVELGSSVDLSQEKRAEVAWLVS